MQKKAGVTWGQRSAPRGDRNAAEPAPSVIRQLSQPQAEVRTNPCRWKRPDLGMRSCSAGQFTADTVSREARPALHSFNAESMGSSFLTSSAPQRPLLTWVGPPPSITHFECLCYAKELSRKLSGELTRRASARQLDVARCHSWHVPPHSLLSKWHSSARGVKH